MTAQNPIFSGKNVLLVEDILDNQDVIKDMSELLGFNLDIVSNGEDAIEKWKEKKYDLIIMDVQMPKKDGYETVKEIRELENKKSYTPILAITSSAFPEDRKKCFQSGMDEYLSKPITFEVFKEKLCTIFTLY